MPAFFKWVNAKSVNIVKWQEKTQYLLTYVDTVAVCFYYYLGTEFNVIQVIWV